MLNKICLTVKQRAWTFFSSMPTCGTVSSVKTSINSQPRWCQLRIPVMSNCSLLHKRPALYHVTHASYHRCLAATSQNKATCQDQEAVQQFTHSLSVEQAAAALAGDGHLRYNQRNRSLTVHIIFILACAMCSSCTHAMYVLIAQWT